MTTSTKNPTRTLFLSPAFTCLALSVATLGCADPGGDGEDATDYGLSTFGGDTDETGGDETAQDTGDADGGTDGGACDSPCGDECCAGDEQCDEQTLECVLDCEGETPCGLDNPVCCGGGEVCYVGECLTPGDSCDAQVCATQAESDCAAGEICDPDLGACMPNLANEACTFTPEPGVFDPVPRWSWGERQPRVCVEHSDCQTGELCDAGFCEVSWPHLMPLANDYPYHVQAIASPMVADLDDDCIPEVVFSSYASTDFHMDGILRVVRGDTGEKVWSLGALAWRVDASSIPAIGDIDADGDLEIVAVHEDKQLMLVDHLGTPIWKADDYPDAEASSAPALANFDLVGDAEIAFGKAVYDSSGKLLFLGDPNQGQGSNNEYGMLPCVADLDGDSRPELIAGNAVYGFTGTGDDLFGYTRWTTYEDGFCGVADFQMDGMPEVVLVHNSVVTVHHGLSGAILDSFLVPGLDPNNNAVGAPNIADFDGDGLPDIGVAGGNHYVVIRFTNGALTQMWRSDTKDFSSNRTGSSVFDFDGDGRSEVVYGDEEFLRIYPGLEPDCGLIPQGPKCDGQMSVGETLFQDIQSSLTRVEYPVIADVDGDFKADIVVATNNSSYQADSGDAGIEVFEDRLDNWVGTRPIWNQHTYHITNVEVDGTIPLTETSNWMTPMDAPYNSYRRNTQGGVQNCAPDLVVQDLGTVGVCTDEVSFSARVCNQGCLGVGAGVKVTFTDSDAGVLGTVATESGIPAGGCLEVGLEMAAPGDPPYELTVGVDDDGMGSGALNECIEDNNEFGPVELCGVIP